MIGQKTHKVGNTLRNANTQNWKLYRNGRQKVQLVHRKAKHKNPKREYRTLKSSIEKLFQNLCGKKIIKVGIVHRKVNTILAYGRKKKIQKKKLNLPIHEEGA